jgi:hypothetical protein
MKNLIHYIFILFSLILLFAAALPAFFIWIFFRFNIMEKIYWACGDFERKHFSQ